MSQSAPASSLPAKSKKFLRLLFGGAGILHFAIPQFFDSIVPSKLPGSSRFYTYASGIVELALAVGLSLSKTRRKTGLAAAIFLIAVFPANVYMYQKARKNTEQKPLEHQAIPSFSPLEILTLLRLPLQIPLIIVALLASKDVKKPDIIAVPANNPA